MSRPIDEAIVGPLTYGTKDAFDETFKLRR